MKQDHEGEVNNWITKAKTLSNDHADLINGERGRHQDNVNDLHSGHSKAMRDKDDSHLTEIQALEKQKDDENDKLVDMIKALKA